METKERKFDINERLIDFAVSVIKVCEGINSSKAGIHLVGQLLRSGTSPSLNYGEAQSAESREDFIHKMKICQKELRETLICLKIISLRGWFRPEKLTLLLAESNELVAIFVASTRTASSKKSPR